MITEIWPRAIIVKPLLNPDPFLFSLLHVLPSETDPAKIHNDFSSATAYTNKFLKKLKVREGLSRPSLVTRHDTVGL